MTPSSPHVGTVHSNSICNPPCVHFDTRPEMHNSNPTFDVILCLPQALTLSCSECSSSHLGTASTSLIATIELPEFTSILRIQYPTRATLHPHNRTLDDSPTDIILGLDRCTSCGIIRCTATPEHNVPFHLMKHFDDTSFSLSTLESHEDPTDVEAATKAGSKSSKDPSPAIFCISMSKS